MSVQIDLSTEDFEQLQQEAIGEPDLCDDKMENGRVPWTPRWTCIA